MNGYFVKNCDFILTSLWQTKNFIVVIFEKNNVYDKFRVL
jgi:hypothetical protein